LPIHFLADRDRRHLDFETALAVAVGDNPSGNDRALTEVEGLPFFSVAAEPSATPAHLRALHVGGLERGTALLLDAFCDRLEAGAPPFDGLEAMAARCRTFID
jgi:hypothetical protein